jgi:predicted DNA-binding transcriptional regulator YafY
MAQEKKEHDTIAVRLSSILSKLYSGERVQIAELAEEFNVTPRTLQRDFNERLEHFPICKENGCYFVEPSALGHLTPEDIKLFATLSGIKKMYPLLNKEFIVDLINMRTNKAYLVKNQGFEDSSKSYDMFEKLSGAILRSWHVGFIYSNKQREVHPYKLVNNNGVWYLLADENGTLKNFTVSKIERLTWDENSFFTPKKEFLQMIENNDTNWFSQTNFEVVLEIEHKAKEYFFRKDILPNKRILEEHKEYFVLSTYVSYDDEILRVVKYWLPFIRIVSPLHLQEKLNKTLQNYLDTF